MWVRVRIEKGSLQLLEDQRDIMCVVVCDSTEELRLTSGGIAISGSLGYLCTC